MTSEHVTHSALLLFNKLREQGAEVVFGAKGQNGRVGLAKEPFTAVQGSDRLLPKNVELRTEEDVIQWLR